MAKMFNKPIKMLILTLMSIIVVSVSAATYYNLIMEPRVATSAPTIELVAGDDSATAGATGYAIDGTWARFTSLKAYPNATLTYEEAINLSNTDASNAHSVRFRHKSITNLNGSATPTNFTRIAFILIAQNGTTVISSFNYTGGASWSTPSTTSYVSIPANEEWAIRVETLAVSGSMANVMVEIDMYIDVQE
ncbi:MAG: hypothetical protein JSV05_04930 [Candidatus Bathyarchaeota archaeon]|nr:MAG: hypothetical protein JSV05_04930 [Candidatus Bathyarchaeota archaeon]